MTSRPLLTSRIYDKLLNILNFFTKTSYDEDVINIYGPYSMLVMNNPPPENSSDSIIEIFEKDGCNVRLYIQHTKNNDLWIGVSASNCVSRPYVEFYYNGPGKSSRKIMTDCVLETILNKEFYNFLLTYNEELIKLKLV